MFWQTIKPFLSKKTESREEIALIENEKLVSDNTEAANCLNNFFSNIVKTSQVLFLYRIYFIKFQVLIFLALT